MQQQPSVGRMVHYVSQGSPVLPDGTQVYPSTCRAAVITEVEDPAGQAGGGIVALTVFNPEGLHFIHGISHVEAEHLVSGSWHWPERTP